MTSPTPYQLLPRLTDEEYAALREDIAANGVRVPIDVDENDTILDGHHRAWITADLGIDCPKRVVAGLTDEQKRTHAVAVNVHRRSLTREQRRELIQRSLKADPQLSDRQHAARTGADHKTVGNQRAAMEGRGEIPHVDERTDTRGRQQPAARTAPESPRATDTGLLAGEDWTESEDESLAWEDFSDEDEEPEPEPAPVRSRPAPVMLALRTHTGDEVPYPKPSSPATFNQTTGPGISWAQWSWNPVTGCLHGCDYCYARELANSERLRSAYPAGFTPLFHHERLDAPANTAIPAQHRDDEHQRCGDGACETCAWRRVFVCSMADLYGRWVPDEWISKVHASCLANPQWNYIHLTKFPDRYVGLDFAPTSWVGTSVDEQKRVRIAERAFRQIDGVAVKWLSLEPLKEPLEFTDLSMFDWVVIGAQTETRQPSGVVPAFAPPAEWVLRIHNQAREAGCRVHWKPNLVNGRPGMRPIDEYPTASA